MSEHMTITHERTDAMPVILAFLRPRHVAALLDKHFPTHGHGTGRLCTESAACTKKGDAAQKVNRMLLSRLSIEPLVFPMDYRHFPGRPENVATFLLHSFRSPLFVLLRECAILANSSMSYPC